MQIPERLPFTIQTHTGSPTGYAETAVVMIRGLLEEGVEVHYLCTHDDFIYEPPSYDAFVNDIRKIEPEDEPIQIVYSIAPLFHHNSGKYKIGWTMMETDRLSDRWVRACNKMGEGWCPTYSNKESFVASGVRVPVKVVPLPIDTKRFTPNLLPMIYHGDHDFRFFAVGWWQLRKRWDLLCTCFQEVFSDKKNVGLIIKTICQEGHEPIIDQIHNWIGKECDDQIAVIEGAYPWWEYAMMMRSAHAFVLPTAGEGFGCPPLQALALGMPVIVTDCLGTGETMRDEDGNVYPGVRLTKAGVEPTLVQHEYYRGSNWWAGDPEDLKAAMWDMYTNYAEWKEQAKTGCALVHANYSGSAVALRIKKELSRIYEELGASGVYCPSCACGVGDPSHTGPR